MVLLSHAIGPTTTRTKNMTENHNHSHTTSEGGGHGSLQRGLSGDYDFSIADILSESWSKVRGSKWTFQLALTAYLLFYVGTVLLLMQLFPDADPVDHSTRAIALNLIQSLITALVTLPAATGISMLGLRRAVDAPIKARMIFGYYQKTLPLFLASLGMYIGIMLGFLLLIVPGIYLSIAYLLSAVLVVDKNLGPWQALEASRKAISKHWFKVLGLSLTLFVFNCAALFLTLGIGLIWTLPLSCIAMGVLYRIIFGCEQYPDTADHTIAQSF